MAQGGGHTVVAESSRMLCRALMLGCWLWYMQEEKARAQLINCSL